jgi:hypothetical protein
MSEKKCREFRPPVLERFKTVWLTSEAHALLRKEKPRQEKSIEQLVQDLILEKYGNKDSVIFNDFGYDKSTRKHLEARRRAFIGS